MCAGRGGDQAVFTGDLTHSPIQARYPDLVMRVDYDQRQASATGRTFLERYCDTPTLCCTMHFPSPSVGRIKRWATASAASPSASRICAHNLTTVAARSAARCRSQFTRRPKGGIDPKRTIICIPQLTITKFIRSKSG